MKKTQRLPRKKFKVEIKDGNLKADIKGYSQIELAKVFYQLIKYVDESVKDEAKF